MNESFYGGRTGISFVIVKRFDAISLENTTYRVREYATTRDGQYFLYDENGFIERTADNYTTYTWNATALDGSFVDTVPQEGSPDVGSHQLPEEYAEGMVQCFTQGGDSTDVVNYGEYVVIDTIAGLNERTNPDNGKVYRRGMNYDGPLGGAEYIGQFVGPTADVAEISLDSAGNVIDKPGSHSAVWTPREADDLTGGLIPGRYFDQGGVEQFNDNIHYGWFTLRDACGNIIGSLIGFTFPYLIEEYHATPRSTYYTIDDPIPVGKNVGDIIDNTLELISREDDESHPFYQKWMIHIPKGIRGDEFTNLRRYNCRVKEDATYYADIECTLPITAPTLADPHIDMSTYIIDRTPEEIGLKVDNENEMYVRQEDTWSEQACYTFTVYDNRVEGEKQLIVLGDYNVISAVRLKDNGILEVTFTTDGPVDINTDTPIRWIKYDGTQPASVTNGLYVDSQGNLNVKYNTGELETQLEAIPWIKGVTLDHDTGVLRITFNNNNPSIDKTPVDNWDVNPDDEAFFHTVLDWVNEIRIDPDGSVYYKSADGSSGTWSPQIKKIPWITDVDFDDVIGRFTVSFNNDELQNAFDPNEWDAVTHSYTKSLRFPKTMTLDEQGILTLVYINGQTEIVNQGHPIKWLKDVQINTTSGAQGALEGSGNQKVKVTYNTRLITPGQDDTEEIGEPINYIVDAQIASSTILADLNQDIGLTYHLLVYYSDPVRRTGSTITYRSPRLGEDVTGWVDMGMVRGEAGGLHIIATVSSVNDLKDSGGTPIPPEKWGGPSTVIPPIPGREGWAMAVESPNDPNVHLIYVYNYGTAALGSNGDWVSIGSIDDAGLHPESIVGLADATDPTLVQDLKTNGLWFKVNKIVSVH